MSAPLNTFDPRLLTEAAFGLMIRGFLPDLAIFTSGSTDEIKHPGLLIRCRDQAEELAPGSGVFKQRVELELQVKPDTLDPETTSSLIRSLRQTFYRNDLTNRGPMQDLALRLTAASADPLTVYGVIARPEGEVEVSQEMRVYAYRWEFEVHATPTR